MNRWYAPLITGLCLTFSFVLTTGPSAAAQRTVPTTPQTITAYASVLRHYNPELPTWQSKTLASSLLATAQRYHIDTNMLAAIVTVESSWHTHAESYAGAIGLGQLMPGTAQTLGVNPHDPSQNLRGAAHYLYNLLHEFGSQHNRYALVFAAYNAGPKAVTRFGGIPPYGETQHYVVKVLRAWSELRSIVRIPHSALETIALGNGPDVDYWLRDSDNR